jgi:hypothetical protein
MVTRRRYNGHGSTKADAAAIGPFGIHSYVAQDEGRSMQVNVF